MAKVKMNEKVDFFGRITTLDQLDKEGRLEFKAEKVWSKRAESGERMAYFAYIKGTEYYWEISKFAYMSRTGHKINANNLNIEIIPDKAVSNEPVKTEEEITSENEQRKLTILQEIKDNLCNDYLNADDPSVGLYGVGQLNHNIIKDINDNCEGIKVINYNKEKMSIRTDDVKILVYLDKEAEKWDAKLIS